MTYRPPKRVLPAYKAFSVEATPDLDLSHTIRTWECVTMEVQEGDDPKAFFQKVYVTAHNFTEAREVLLRACRAENIALQRAWIAPVGKSVIFARRTKAFPAAAIPHINKDFAAIRPDDGDITEGLI